MTELVATPYISPSQVATAGRCGWAYQHSYKFRDKPAKTPVPLLTGTVLHRAREKWCLDHSLDMVALTREAWLEELVDHAGLHRVCRSYERLSNQSLTLQQEILNRRPDIKVPAMTKDFKESPVATAIRGFTATNELTLKASAYDWSKKAFTEAYDETVACATKYQEFYRDKPESILTEVRFQVEHEGLILMGVVDDVSLYVDDDGEVLGYIILDGKTYAKRPHPLKDFLQLVVYFIAARQLLPQWLADVDLPFNPDWPIWVGIDMMKGCEIIPYLFNNEHVAQATNILGTYQGFRDIAPLLPNFKNDCDRCEWYIECMDRIGLDIET